MRAQNTVIFPAFDRVQAASVVESNARVRFSADDVAGRGFGPERTLHQIRRAGATGAMDDHASFARGDGCSLQRTSGNGRTGNWAENWVQ